MIGGRNGWIAWPVGLVCAGVVAGLVWLARPAVPAVIGFVGNTLRAGMTSGIGPQATADPTTTPGEDCRSLYPDALWLWFTWQSSVSLDQTLAQPQTMATAVRDALDPQVSVTCVWHDGPERAVATTASRVHATAPAVVRRGFVAAGFACDTIGGVGIHCTRASGDVTEDDIVRDGLWLSTTERQWHPPDYTGRLAARLWP